MFDLIKLDEFNYRFKGLTNHLNVKVKDDCMEVSILGDFFTINWNDCGVNHSQVASGDFNGFKLIDGDSVLAVFNTSKCCLVVKNYRIYFSKLGDGFGVVVKGSQSDEVIFWRCI